MYVNLAIFPLLIVFGIVYSQNIHKRFEYKYSFKGPYLAQKDNQVPFWTYSGNAIASEDNFRITPSLRSQKGQAWATNPTNFEWWEVEFIFRVNGRGRLGADGLAFWFTQSIGVEGPVFGGSDKWYGLGLFFDSFDNDNKRNNPYIMGMVNDGTLIYDHEHDGVSQQAGGCLRDFRNKPFPVRAKIEYFNNILTVYIHNGMTNNEKDYEICFRAENVHLPNSGHFGVTAATGGLADDHDVLKFLVYSLRSHEEMAQILQNKEEEERFQQEFEQYQQKTQKAKDEYMAQNPDAAKRYDEEYETSEQRDLRQIFQGQGQIYDIVKQLHLKLEDLIGRQDRTYSLVSALQSGGQVALPPGQVPPAVPVGSYGDSIKRHEVDAMLSNQRDIIQNSRDIKSFVGDIQQMSQQLLAKAQQGQGSAQPIGGQYDFHVTLKELNEGINIVKRDVGIANQRLGANQAGGVMACPPTSCVSTAVLIGLMVTQVVILLCYFAYRDSREAKAKKFY